MTKKRRSAALALLFVAIFALWWGISVLSQTGTAPAAAMSAQSGAVVVAYEAATTTVVRHRVNNGVNFYSGTLPLPSQCDMLGEGVAMSGQEPVHMTLLLTLTADTPCMQAPPVESTQPFAASIAIHDASSSPVFDGVTVNGVIVPFSLVEAH